MLCGFKNVNLGENVVKVIVDMEDNKIDYSSNLDSIKVTVKENRRNNMSLRINNLTLEIDEDLNLLKNKVCKN